MNENLKILSPYELGESHNKGAIKYIQKFLNSSIVNDRRLAASAAGKLFDKFPKEVSKLKNDLLKNIDEDKGAQTAQYSLKTLLKLDLNNNDINLIKNTKFSKDYNKKLVEEIINTQSISKLENINIIENNNQEIEYTNSQKIALNKILSFLDSDEEVFILKGAAGTGKTTICSFITNHIENCKNIDFELLAPTGRAARVISLKTNKEAKTIHKHIYKQDKIVKFTSDDKTTNLKTSFSLNQNLCELDTIYLIDEASMISDITTNINSALFYGSGNLLNDIINFTIKNNSYNNKIIFIGDQAQLPPINCNTSPALNKVILKNRYKLKANHYTMRDIVRQDKNNEILKDANFLRNQIELNKFTNYTISTNSTNCKQMNYFELEKHFVENYKIGSFNNPIMITHSNFSSRFKNEWIRKKIFKKRCSHLECKTQEYCKNTDLLYLGENLISVQNSLKFDILNGDNFIVKEILNDSYEEKSVYKDAQDKKPVILKFIDIIIIREKSASSSERIEQKVKIILNCLNSNENSLSVKETNALNAFAADRHKKLRKSKKSNTLQTDLFDLAKDEFIKAFFEDEYRNALQVKYGYSITCHKSQGGEWPNVYIDFSFSTSNSNGALSMDYFRWSYTALTRSVNNIYHTNQRKVKKITHI